MKNDYFTPKNIDLKARNMLERIRKVSYIRSINFKISNSALLIVDMQNYFLAPDSHAFIPNAIPIVKRIRKLAQKFISLNRPVISTRHINTKKNAKLLGKWWSDIIMEDSTKLSEIHEQLKFPEAIKVKKTQYDAFYETNLEGILKKKRIKQMVLTGVMTHLCCETTARSAFVRGFEVFLPVDGTATQSEEFHVASMISLSHGFCVPVLIKEIMKNLGKISEKK